jgi:hypothetical protein
MNLARFFDYRATFLPVPFRDCPPVKATESAASSIYLTLAPVEGFDFSFVKPGRLQVGLSPFRFFVMGQSDYSLCTTTTRNSNKNGRR